MNDKITVCLGKGGQREMAESFARKNNVPIMDKPGEHLTVMFDSRGVSLTGYGLTYQGDFEGMLHRVTNGRLSHEMLVRAVKTEGEHLKAIDATGDRRTFEGCAPACQKASRIKRHCFQNETGGG